MKTRFWIMSPSALILVVAATVLAVACDSSSPTEPQTQSNVTVTMTGNGAGQPGTYTIVTNVCDCTAIDVALLVDGFATAKLKCSDTQTLTLVAGQHTIAFEWPDSRPAASITFEASASSSGIITAVCAYR